MSVLDDAAAIISGERREIYGLPEEEFPRIATMWSAILGTDISAEQVCLCMIAGKLLRLATTPSHRDSQVDVCGYIRILEILCENCKKNIEPG